MLSTSRSLLRLTSRVSSTAPVGRVFVRLSPASFPQAYRASLFSSKSTNNPPNQSIDREHEKKVAQETLKSDPSAVTTESSVRHVIEESQAPTDNDHDMAAELKHDIDAVKDTFSFSSVPRESRILGLAGTLPYMGTSLSTLFLSWDLNKHSPTGNSLYDAVFVDHETAKHLLTIIEPIQLGYGAVLISFLGAIHWGLEYAEKQPLLERTRFRYGVGLAASIVAWPTLLMPVEYALTAQFATFVALYFVDSRATTRGWAPHWYGTYRFLLTAMVGLAIFISLVGRTKISQGQTLTSHGLEERFGASGIADHDTDWAKLEKEEMERVKKEKEEAEKKAKKEEQERKQNEMKAEKGAKGPEQEKSEEKESENDDGVGADQAKNSQDKKDKAETKKGSKDDEETKGEDGDDQEDASSKKNKSAKGSQYEEKTKGEDESSKKDKSTKKKKSKATEQEDES